MKNKIVVPLMSVSLFIATMSQAAEQKIVFVGESIKHAKDTKEHNCQGMCKSKEPRPNLDALLHRGGVSP